MGSVKNSVNWQLRAVGGMPESLLFTAAGPKFDFQTYMTSTAKQVNAALDKAVPSKFPETLNDAMRSVSATVGSC